MCAKLGLRKAQLHEQSRLRWTDRKQEVDIILRVELGVGADKIKKDELS